MLDDVVKGAVEGLVRGILSRRSDESANQIEAQSFVLRDGKGRGRAVLAMLEEGPGLTLLDGREEIKALLGLARAVPTPSVLGDGRTDPRTSPRGER